MGYAYHQLKQIENGICVECLNPHTTGKPRCTDCITAEKVRDAIRSRQRKLNEMLVPPSAKQRLAELWDYLGVMAAPESIKAAYDLEQREPVRFIFFRWLFDSRKRYVGQDFGDRYDKGPAFGGELNELIADALQYAATVPDPLKEIQEWQLKRDIETRGRSTLAFAMSHYDGMAAEDFEVVRPLYA